MLCSYIERERQTSLFNLYKLQDVWQILNLVSNAGSSFESGSCTGLAICGDGSPGCLASACWQNIRRVPCILCRYDGTLASLRHEIASCQIPNIHARAGYGHDRLL